MSLQPTPLAHQRYGPETSDRAPVLIAHGLFGSGRNWTTLAKRIGADRPVASVDIRNHGESPRSDVMDYPLMGADLLATARALFDRPPILIGHSMGGKAAMAAVLASPDAVAALMVVDIAPMAYAQSEHSGYIAAMRALDLSRATRRSEADALLAKSVPDPMLRAFFLQSLAFEDAPDGGRRGVWRLNLDALERSMVDLVGWPGGLTRKSADLDALFIRGGASDYVTDAAEPAIRACFPRAEIATVAGAGHWLHAEAPDAFLGAAEPWLAER